MCLNRLIKTKGMLRRANINTFIGSGGNLPINRQLANRRITVGQ